MRSPGRKCSRRSCRRDARSAPGSVEGEVLDAHVRNLLTAEQGKQRGNGGVAAEPEVFPQRAIEPETVAVLGHQGPLADGGAAMVRVAGPQADAVSQAEPFGIDQRDFLVVPVRIGGQLGGDRWLFHEHGIRPAAQQPHFGAEVDGISEPVAAGQDPHRAATQSGHVIHGRLEHAVVGAHQVGMLPANGHGEPLFPSGLDRVARSGAGMGNGRRLVGPCHQSAGGGSGGQRAQKTAATETKRGGAGHGSLLKQRQRQGPLNSATPARRCPYTRAGEGKGDDGAGPDFAEGGIVGQ